MTRLRVWNKGGLPSRTIPIPGRNAMRPNGRLSMIGNVAERTELDWTALLAAFSTDNVVVEISPIEADLIDQFMPAMFPCGSNVELQCSKDTKVRLVSDGAFGHIERPRYSCCGLGFMSSLDYGRHKRNDPAHRQEPKLNPTVELSLEPDQVESEPLQDQVEGDEHEWLAATTETR